MALQRRGQAQQLGKRCLQRIVIGAMALRVGRNEAAHPHGAAEAHAPAHGDRRTHPQRPLATVGAEGNSGGMVLVDCLGRLGCFTGANLGKTLVRV